MTALGSWLDARAQTGQWLIRIDDLDGSRCRSRFTAQILATLSAFGLESAAAPSYQSSRLFRYQSAFEQLATRLPVFRCRCSRRQLRGETDGIELGVCVGNCRREAINADECAWRADLTGLTPIRVLDRSLGALEFDPQRHRDLVLRRRDGYFTYAFAAVLDDADGGVSDVVRGADLASGTAVQLALQQVLELPTPRYLHLPLLIDQDGRKLAKSRQSLPPDPQDKIFELRRCLRWLRQAEPPSTFVGDEAVTDMLCWSAEHWCPEAFKGLGTQRVI